MQTSTQLSHILLRSAEQRLKETMKGGNIGNEIPSEMAPEAYELEDTDISR